MESNELQQHIRGISRVTWAGLWINLGLAALKIAAGTLGHSRAVVADGVHSLSDLVTDVAVLVGVRVWSAPADDCHPYGHRRVETLVTIIIGIMLATAGIGIGWDAIAAFGTGEVAKVGSVALLAALVSIITKEILYRWTVREGRKLNSSAVVANAWHHRSDALSSVPAALAAGVSLFVPGWAFLDLIGAVVVAVFILHAAWSICKPSLGVLIDKAAPEEVVEQIYDMACSVSGVQSVHRLRTRYHGAGIVVDMHIGVISSLTVKEGHDIADSVEELLRRRGPEVVDVLVHVDPWDEKENCPVK